MRISGCSLHLEPRLRSNGPAKVHGLFRDNLEPRAKGCPVANVGARAMDGLSKHKVCLGSSLNPRPKGAY
jgi:hypothetical protein